MKIDLFPIGRILEENDELKITLLPAFRRGLKGLEGYSHVQVLWWMDGCDEPQARGKLVENRPYTRGPEEIGVFATRSPERPNPIALSAAEILRVNEEAGTITLAWLAALPGSPVLDLKPYTPSVARVERPRTPRWCAHWPQSCEVSGDFDWSAEFNF